jgi:hypothetical protein
MAGKNGGWLQRLFQVSQQLRSPLAIAGLVLLGLYAVVREILERISPEKLGPSGSFLIIRTILQSVFVIALVTILASVIAYVLPRILPKSLFAPAPKLEYGVVVFRLIDPFEVSPLARVMQGVELFPGFPYYSRESDHPSAWPPRVFSDRTMLFDEFAKLYSDPDLRAHLAADPTFRPESVTFVGGGPEPEEERALRQYIAGARLHLLDVAGKGQAALDQLLGPAASHGFVEIERRRAEMRQWFPNRLAIVRVHNSGRLDITNLGIELEIAALIYDCAIEADPDKVRKSVWDGNSHRVSFERLPRDYTAEVRLWYRYQSVKEKAFGDKIDVIHELTQGLQITNIAASQTQVRFEPALVSDLAGYERLYLGDARKKDSYEAELSAYYDQAGKELLAHLQKLNQTNPTLRDVKITDLVALNVSDSQVDSLWLGLRSPAGRFYDAVHVFQHPKGPYVLLCSKDRDEQDLRAVQSTLCSIYQGTSDGHVSDRSDDICTTVEVAGGFSKEKIASAAAALAQAGYHDVSVTQLHYHLAQGASDGN